MQCVSSAWACVCSMQGTCGARVLCSMVTTLGYCIARALTSPVSQACTCETSLHERHRVVPENRRRTHTANRVVFCTKRKQTVTDEKHLHSATMAPPESNAVDFQQPQQVGTFDTQNYQTRIKEYYRKLDGYKLIPKHVDTSRLRVSGPQGKVEPLTIIDDPADWKAADFQGREDAYIYQLTTQDVAEITSAVAKVKATGVSTEEDILKLTKEDFPLPHLRPKLLEIGREVNSGKGFHLVRGFPVEEYKQDRLGLVLAFWALGLHLGRPLISQTDYKADGTVFGSVLNHVTDGRFVKAKQEGYTKVDRSKIDITRLAFHSDQGATDLIALLSITAAPGGGESKWVSAVAIHNELLRLGRQDLVEALSKEKSWWTPRKANQQAYERKPDGSFKGFEEEVPFAYHDGYLSVHFEVNKYQDIKLTPLQEEAVLAVATIAEDPKFHLAKTLQPGDLEIIHNPTIFHSRGDIFDGDSHAEKRHLLRWWVASDANKRPIAPLFAPRSNVQPTGGFIVPEGSQIRLPLYPYSRHDGQGQAPEE